MIAIQGAKCDLKSANGLNLCLTFNDILLKPDMDIIGSDFSFPYPAAGRTGGEGSGILVIRARNDVN